MSKQGKVYDYFMRQVENLKATRHIGNAKVYERTLHMLAKYDDLSLIHISEHALVLLFTGSKLSIIETNAIVEQQLDGRSDNQVSVTAVSYTHLQRLCQVVYLYSKCRPNPVLLCEARPF